MGQNFQLVLTLCFYKIRIVDQNNNWVSSSAK